MKEEILNALKSDNRLPFYLRHGNVEGDNGKNKKHLTSLVYQTHLYIKKDLYKPILLMKL